MKINRRRAAVVGVVAAVAAATTACGGSSDAGTQSASSTSLKVATLPIIPSAPVYVAADRGYFSDSGLSVTTTVGASEGAVVTSLASGQFDCAVATPTATIQAAGRGLPVALVAQVSRTPDHPVEGLGPLLITKTSGIKSAKDLNGKTIGVGSLGGGGEISLRAAIDRLGGDSKSIKVIQIPFPNMKTALERGQVAAVSTVSPFDGPIKAAGAVELFQPSTVAAPGSMLAGIACNTAFIQKNRATVQKFLSSVKRATDDITKDPTLAKQVLPKFSPIPKALIPVVVTPPFDSSLDPQGVQTWIDLTVKYGFLDKAPDIGKVLVTP